ncbi:hypothetical protein DNTS_003887 [Danionella cerebrum]|uniref:C-type lectin domain-containing protein n=1 Tax=Danionella cerebrum TaxID=2873325 RepID=A0A553N2E2_9TELE|nr:hypothetical protein DNTS_003887 [Danionella translucida]
MEEQENLSKYLNEVYYWIGLSDSKVEGDWMWVDNTYLNSNLSLWESEPDDWKVENELDGEDCAILKGEQWGDNSCLNKMRRICEIPCSPPQ